MTRTIKDELNARIIQHYANDGKLCALGWTAFQAGLMADGFKPDTEQHLQVIRDAFYMGMQHCYSSLMQTLGEGGSEAEDFAIMGSFTTELHGFLLEFLQRHPVFAQASNLTGAANDPGSVQPETKGSPDTDQDKAQGG